MLKFLLFLLVLTGGILFLPQEQSLEIKNSEKISAIVVPHHDLVKAQREQFFDSIAQKIAPPETVILVGPNHYEVGRGDIQTTEHVWNLSNGEMLPNTEVIKSLPAQIEDSSFQNEHSIFLILPDIKRVWPQAKIVPIILKQKADIKALHIALEKSCRDCLLVASVDFSHYNPAILANLHDDLTLRALQNLDGDLLREKAEVDSPASLELMTLWAKQHETAKFTVSRRTNSGEIFQNPDIETTTHFFGYYSAGLKAQPEKSVSFLIGGDMMFAREIHYTFQKDLKESMAKFGERVFWGTDLSLINFEGMASKTPVVPDPKPTFTFVFPPEAIEVLKWLRVNVVSIDNNHANGVRPEGMQVLPITVQGEGLKLTAIGIYALTEPKDIKGEISSAIRRIKSDPDQRVIIYPHWGEEYQFKHNAMQERLAHEWIDAGADLVVGAHPHVIQDAEVYKGKPIIYSLGNLLFDQNWSQATQEGMLIGGKFTEDGLEIFGLPVISKNFQPELARGATKTRLLQKIEGGMIQP